MLAALHVASIIDSRGSRVEDAFESYWHHATGGSFPPDDLKRGERLLVAAGVVAERDGVLYPTQLTTALLEGTAEDATALLTERVLAAGHVAPGNLPEAELSALLPDADRREELLVALGRRYDDAAQKAIGDAGEEIVLEAVRRELTELGYADLARAAWRVSLLSDQLGYDISAPRVTGLRRLLEVKATTSEADPITIHLSRNEAETAARLPDWFMVVCAVDTVDPPSGRVLGWTDLRRIAGHLPNDTGTGRWEKAALRVPRRDLTDGLPRVVS